MQNRKLWLQYHVDKAQKKGNTNSIVEVPEYHAGAAYRHMELLLGRIKDLGQMGPFTTQNGTGMSEVVGVMKKPVEFRRGDS